MKGKKLSYEEVKKLPVGTPFYIIVYGKEEIATYHLDAVFTNNAQYATKILIKDAEAYEFIKEPEEKLYSNSEVMAMLEKNPKLVFETENYKVSSDGNLIKITNKHIGTSDYKFIIGDKWKLIKTPVTFMEAVNAYNVGMDIECIVNESERYLFDLKGRYNGGRRLDNESYPVTTKMILEGKWYIKGEEDES